MNIEDPKWEEYETRFRALVEDTPILKGAHPELASSELMLCLYGENGIEPEQEFKILSQLEAQKGKLSCVEMTTAYWEDLILYLP
jgi:hypothetical protein